MPSTKAFAASALTALVATGTMVAMAAHAGDNTLEVSWKDGLNMRSADGRHSFKLGGRIMNDWAFFDDDAGLTAAVGSQSDGSEFRRARFYVAGTIYEQVIFKAQYDFAGGDAEFKDVYMGLTGLPALGTVKVGHFYEPFGLETITSSKHITFLERALTTDAFGPERSNGIGFQTVLSGGAGTLAAGIFRDSASDGDSSGDNLHFTARATAAPVNTGDRVLHIGVAYSKRDPDNDTASYDSRPESHMAATFIDTGDITDATGVELVGLEAAVIHGPLSLQAEWMQASVDSAGTGNPDLTSYYVYASYFLTGEHRVYKGSSATFSRVRPNNNYLGDGGSGALELALRYSSADLNDGGVTGGELDDITLGLNWLLNPNTRVMFNYTTADLDGAGDSDIVQTRFQIDF